MTATSSALAERTVPPSVPAAAAAPAETWPNAPKRTFEIERFIARLIISVSNVPEAPTSMPGDDQDVVLELEAGCGRGQAGEGVQERDHDRHVGAADREDEEHAEEGGAREQGPHQPLLLRARSDGDPRCEGGSEDESVHQLLAWVGDRTALDQLLELREGDHRAGERDSADQRREHDRDADVDLQVAGVWRAVVELRPGNERCRAAADAVEQRHHLRHRGHLHAPGRDRPEAAADDHSEDDLPVADDLALREGDADREQHPGRADPVAEAGLVGLREEAKREDEGHDRDQIEEVGGGAAHCCGPDAWSSSLAARSGRRRLNISSIRSVTTKPPTTFAEARITAMNPRIHVRVSLSP